MLSANQLLRNTGNLFPIHVSFFIAASFGLYLAVLSLSNEEMNNGTSILIATSGGLIAIFFFYFMLQKYFVVSILKYGLIFFLIRLTIGIAHYLIFLESPLIILSLYLTSFFLSFSQVFFPVTQYLIAKFLFL